MEKIREELKIRYKIFRTIVWLFFRNYIWKDNIVPYKKIKCPVCGTTTLDSYWICPRCHWEYEDGCESRPDFPTGPNDEISLNEYKKMYNKLHK
ncbi:MAG: hypothetical protein EOM59_00215 [Clostridia bacterium]|nr:hypothetical protein [Clostridia bacterium]